MNSSEVSPAKKRSFSEGQAHGARIPYGYPDYEQKFLEAPKCGKHPLKLQFTSPALRVGTTVHPFICTSVLVNTLVAKKFTRGPR